jgi:hypothetical protein
MVNSTMGEILAAISHDVHEEPLQARLLRAGGRVGGHVTTRWERATAVGRHLGRRPLPRQREPPRELQRIIDTVVCKP